MNIIRSAAFTADRAWGALDIANLNGITVRLHWTDQPYRWHVNDGEEVSRCSTVASRCAIEKQASSTRRCSKRVTCSTHRPAPSTSRIRSVKHASS